MYGEIILNREVEDSRIRYIQVSKENIMETRWLYTTENKNVKHVHKNRTA